MKSLILITCLFIGISVSEISAESEELSPEVLSCLAEIHVLSKQEDDQEDKCDEEFPTHGPNDDENDANREKLVECYEESDTPEFLAQVDDVKARCKSTFALIESEDEKVMEALSQQG